MSKAPARRESFAATETSVVPVTINSMRRLMERRHFLKAAGAVVALGAVDACRLLPEFGAATTVQQLQLAQLRLSVDHIMRQPQVGLEVKLLGRPRVVEGEANVAAQFPFNLETLLRLRKSHKISGPVIERIYQMPPEGRAAA